MASILADRTSGADLGERLLACVAGQGSAAHPYLRNEALLRGPDASRNLSDAVHFLCMLHGRHPGVVDHAADRCLDSTGRKWFAEATSDFTRERAFLARLAVAAGPIPSTPGAGGSEAAVLSQRHAIEMLARSERKGCALGAALAVVLDWHSIRLVLDAAARRFGTDVPRPPTDAFETVAVFLQAADLTPGMERALMFGAEQIAVQHSGLWDLLEVRQQARALA